MKNTNEWIKWTSSSIPPVHPETLVQVVFVEGGPCRTLPAGDLYWWLDDSLPVAIAQYRIYKG